MPNRTVAGAISAFWLVMMGLLVQRDVLPQWRINQRLDLRTVARSIEGREAVRWAVYSGETRIGSAQTEWRRRAEDWTEFLSTLELKTVPFMPELTAALFANGVRWKSSFIASPDGNLHHFDIQAFLDDSSPWLTVHGRVDGELLRVQFRSGSGSISHEEKFYYEPHSLMTTSLSPIDKMPNLNVGQTWQYRVMNPLTNSTDTVRCEVTKEQVITRRGDPVATYLVEQHYGQIRARSWVDRDGIVLRQEVPFGLNPLVLERE